MARSLSSQLTLRMTSNSLSLFEVIGRRCPRTIFCVGGYVGRRSMICSIAACVVCFALPVLWRTHFLCLDVEDSVPHTPCKPSSARLDPALFLVTPFCFGARFCARNRFCLCGFVFALLMICIIIFCLGLYKSSEKWYNIKM